MSAHCLLQHNPIVSVFCVQPNFSSTLARRTTIPRSLDRSGSGLPYSPRLDASSPLRRSGALNKSRDGTTQRAGSSPLHRSLDASQQQQQREHASTEASSAQAAAGSNTGSSTGTGSPVRRSGGSGAWGDLATGTAGNSSSPARSRLGGEGTSSRAARGLQNMSSGASTGAAAGSDQSDWPGASDAAQPAAAGHRAQPVEGSNIRSFRQQQPALQQQQSAETSHPGAATASGWTHTGSAAVTPGTNHHQRHPSYSSGHQHSEDDYYAASTTNQGSSAHHPPQGTEVQEYGLQSEAHSSLQTSTPDLLTTGVNNLALSSAAAHGQSPSHRRQRSGAIRGMAGTDSGSSMQAYQ